MSSQIKSESLTRDPIGSLEVIPVSEIGLFPFPALIAFAITEEKGTLDFDLLLLRCSVFAVVVLLNSWNDMGTSRIPSNT